MPLQSALTSDELLTYERDGYYIARGLWSAEEIEATRRRFDDLAERGRPIPAAWPNAKPGDWAWEPDLDSPDPLRRYPRIMHPHLFDPASRDMLIDPRIEAVLTGSRVSPTGS